MRVSAAYWTEYQKVVYLHLSRRKCPIRKVYQKVKNLSRRNVTDYEGNGEACGITFTAICIISYGTCAEGEGPGGGHAVIEPMSGNILLDFVPQSNLSTTIAW